MIIVIYDCTLTVFIFHLVFTFVFQYAEKFDALETNILSQPDDDYAATDPPSVSRSDVLEDESTEQYPFDPEEFRPTDIRGNVKQGDCDIQIYRLSSSWIFFIAK